MDEAAQTFNLDQTFLSLEELIVAVKEYELRNHIRLKKTVGRTIDWAKKNESPYSRKRNFDSEDVTRMKYVKLEYCCDFNYINEKCPRKGTSKLVKSECPMRVRLRLTDDNKTFVVSFLEETHNHDLPRDGPPPKRKTGPRGYSNDADIRTGVGMHPQAKKLMLNVYKYFQELYEQGARNDSDILLTKSRPNLAKLTAKVAGLSEKTVKRYVSIEKKKNNGLFCQTQKQRETDRKKLSKNEDSVLGSGIETLTTLTNSKHDLVIKTETINMSSYTSIEEKIENERSDLEVNNDNDDEDDIDGDADETAQELGFY